MFNLIFSKLDFSKINCRLLGSQTIICCVKLDEKEPSDSSEDEKSGKDSNDEESEAEEEVDTDEELNKKAQLEMMMDGNDSEMNDTDSEAEEKEETPEINTKDDRFSALFDTNKYERLDKIYIYLVWFFKLSLLFSSLS